MKNLSLLSIATLFGLTLNSGCILSVTDDVADTTSDDDVGTTETGTSADGTATDTGDGDGDTTTTDSDVGDTTAGDTTAGDTADTTTDTGTANMCGWDAANSYYDCGFEGADPGGTPIECPDGLVEGDPCATTGITGAGCCDANGDNWYCAQGDVVAFVSCA